jgi:hypothetical protein
MSYSTIAASSRWPTWEIWLPMVFGFAFGVGVVLAAYFALSPSTKARQVCDALVQTLLTTRDTIELQRTGILVRELNCDVSRRAGPVLYRALVGDPH